MEWYFVLAFFIFGLIFFLLLGFPIAFSFLAIDLLGIIIFMGTGGLKQVTLQIFSSLSTFTLAPIPMFILMGEIMFQSKLANDTIDVIDKCLGRLPGRLSLLAAAGGTIFSALSGSSIAHISVGKLLLAGAIPGLLMGALYATYIIVRCWLDPSLAPRYDVSKVV